MTKEEINQIERSYSHSDCLVFSIGEKVFVAETVLKHQKEATVEMVDCSEIDETCFETNGEYYGDVIDAPLKTFILDDPCADNRCCVVSVYYEDEVREVITNE